MTLKQALRNPIIWAAAFEFLAIAGVIAFILTRPPVQPKESCNDHVIESVSVCRKAH